MSGRELFVLFRRVNFAWPRDAVMPAVSTNIDKLGYSRPDVLFIIGTSIIHHSSNIENIKLL